MKLLQFPVYLMISVLLAACGGGGGGGGGSSTTGGTTDNGAAPSDSDFVFQKPSYITDAFSATNRNLTFGITPMDWWGKSYNSSYTKYEPSKEYVDSALNRSMQIGSTLMMITDFHVLHPEDIINEQANEGAMTMTQAEMNSFVSKARSYGQSNLILWNNLYGANSSVTSDIANLHNVPDTARINALFDAWKTVMSKQATKAQAAGFNGMVIDPRDIYFFFNASTYKDKWQAIIDDVKSKFSGSIYFWGGRGTLIEFSNNLTGIDGYIVDEEIQNHLSTVTDESISALKTLWDNYLDSANMVSDLSAKWNVYILLLMPSYNGAIQSGWVEPGAEYPDGQYERDDKEQAVVYEAIFQSIYGKSTLGIDGVISYGYWWSNSIWPDNYWQRSDISHSIRLKDAEHVFYRWTLTFNQ